MRRRHFLLGASLSVTALLLPARLRAQPTADAVRILRAKPGTARLGGPQAAETSIWGYDGGVPGPLLRVRRGEELRVRLVNDLPEATAVHWHGVRAVNGMDGAPSLTQAPVGPGAAFEYRLAPPDAGTFWYHPPLGPMRQSQRGLAGVLIVDEPQPLDVDQDIALLIGDWRPPGAAPDGGKPAAPSFTVNGAPSRDITVRTNERLRLRIANGASQLLRLTVGRHTVTVMAIDGQPASPFQAREGRIALAPGNRADLFVDAVLAPGSTAPLTLTTGAGDVTLIRLVYSTEAPARPAPRPDPDPLPANPLPERIEFRGALKLDLLLGTSVTKAVPMAAGKGPTTGGAAALAQPNPQGSAGGGPARDAAPLFSVKRGRTVMLGLANRSPWPRIMHVHGHSFRLLDDLDDGWKPFWLDTLPVEPQRTGRLAFVADNPGKWRIDDLALGDEGADRAGWFEVT